MLCDLFGPADPQLAEEAEDLRQMAERFRTGEVGEADAKYLHQRSYAVGTSRAGAGRVVSRGTGASRRDPASSGGEGEQQ